MKRSTLLWFSLALLLVASLSFPAQSNTQQLSRVADRIATAVSGRLPGWRRTSVSPLSGPKGGRAAAAAQHDEVIVEQWRNGSSIVKLTIMRHPSANDAVKAIRIVAEDPRMRGNRSDLGDEGYVWSARGEVAFRRGNITVYVSTVGSDAASEEAASDEFAKAVAEGLHTQGL